MSEDFDFMDERTKNNSEASIVPELPKFFVCPVEFISALQNQGTLPGSIPETCSFLSAMERELPEKHELGKKYNEKAKNLLFALESVLRSTIKNRHHLANCVLLLKRETGFTLGEIAEALEKVTGFLFSKSWIFRLGRNGETFEKHPELMQIRDQEIISRLSSLKSNQLEEVVKHGRINGKVSIYDGTRDEIIQQVHELKRAAVPTPGIDISDAALSFFRITKEIQAAKDSSGFAQYSGLVEPIADAFCLILLTVVASVEGPMLNKFLENKPRIAEHTSKINALAAGGRPFRPQSNDHDLVRKAVYSLHDVCTAISGKQRL
jgi:hypothetical protein